MITDFLDCPDGHVFNADLCIIGSGAVGITIAREFLDSHISVIVLESGGYKWEPPTQGLYESEVVGLPHNGTHSGRARMFGGTTALWPGQTLPMDELDFEKRPWVEESGWPIRRADVEPFYRRAERILHLDPIDYAARQWEASQFPAFDSSLLCARMSQFSPKPNFGVTYRRQLHAARNVQVVLHANAVKLIVNPVADSVRAVAIKSLSGKQGQVKARLYVLCCGGIETPRLLLVSDDVEKHGLGNRYDLVGRYFQDHVLSRPARMILNRPEHGLPFLRPFYRNGVSYSPRVVLSPAVQRKRETLHVCMGFPPRQMASEESPVEAARRVYRRIFKAYKATGLRKDLRLMVAGPREVASAMKRRFVKGEPAAKRDGDVCVELQGECEPNWSSQITLSRNIDSIGVRRVKVDWRLTPLVRHTAIVAVETVDAEFRRLGLGHVDLESLELTRPDTPWSNYFSDMYHHIGTCRMSSDPSKGVVNPDCRMHSVDNLFVGGSAVFPIGGYANSTFTIIALAVRLADHLKSTFGRAA
jgi:choline dehydrogenase-like flavoprotein